MRAPMWHAMLEIWSAPQMALVRVHADERGSLVRNLRAQASDRTRLLELLVQEHEARRVHEAAIWRVPGTRLRRDGAAFRRCRGAGWIPAMPRSSFLPSQLR